MNNEVIIRSKKEEDREKVLEVVNSFVKDSFAAYSDEYYSSSIVDEWSNKAKVFLVLETGNKVVGFGFVASYKPFKSCNHVGVLTYFILPEYTGKGLGTKLFNQLISKGKDLGITNYLAHISSRNEQSLNFHKKHGFQEVGRFKDMSVKLGESIDMVWVQKQFIVRLA
ncbi:MAG: N-acetyltransferase [Bacteroidetes bacterium]|nr:N-acetyltransferase [Bacteroidota bacterium]